MKCKVFFSGDLDGAKFLRDELDTAIEAVEKGLEDIDVQIRMKDNDALCEENLDIKVTIEY